MLRTILSEPGAIGELITGDYSFEEATGAFSLFGALLDRVEKEEDQSELCGNLADVVVNAENGAGGEGVEKRMGMVAALFNLRSHGAEKVRLLTKIVDLADASMLAPGEGVSSLSDMLEADALRSSLTVWGGDVGIPEVVKRGLFRAVVRGMDRLLVKLRGVDTAEASVEVEMEKRIKEASDRKQIYLLLILDTYKDEVRLGLCISHCLHTA